MARLTISQKTQRVLRFIAALANPLIAVRLLGYGMDQSELDKGWGLLRAATSVRLDDSPVAAQQSSKTIVQLDAWENFWFPIAQTVLRVRFPAVESWVFRNLTQQEGQDVVLSVTTLVERLEQLETRNGLEGEVAVQADDALKLLSDRGLNESVIGDARKLLVDFASIKPPTTPDPEAQRAAKKEAEREMWAWYLEWSAIARQVITSRRHLRELGYRLTPVGAPGPVVLDDYLEEETAELPEEIDETEEGEETEETLEVA